MISTPSARAAEVAALHASAARHEHRDSYAHRYAGVVNTLRCMAQGGYMPTRAQYNAQRPANWPLAETLTHRLQTTWYELAEVAGLQRQPKRGGVA